MSTTMLALTSGGGRWRTLVLAITIFLTVPLLAGTGLAQTAVKQAAKEPPKEEKAEKPEPIKELPAGPVDEFDRMWLDNIGFRVSTLLAGLGVGGIAVALAAQDTLKNLIGSVMILVDKPYKVGQRIVVKGHDGVVEEIGLRSTKMRLLTGHQTTIPNDEMSRIDIENIGRRPHIRRLSNINVPYDTPLAKVEKAVKIIEDILENHEGMDPEFPPRVYFNEFNPDSLNIIMLYWYHPPDYWALLAFYQSVNTQIMQEFEKE